MKQNSADLNFPRDCLTPLPNENRNGLAPEHGTYEEHVGEVRDLVTQILMKDGCAKIWPEQETAAIMGHSAKPKLINIDCEYLISNPQAPKNLPELRLHPRNHPQN